MKKSRFREEQMVTILREADPRLVRREPNGRHSPVISGPKKPGRSRGQTEERVGRPDACALCQVTGRETKYRYRRTLNRSATESGGTSGLPRRSLWGNQTMAEAMETRASPLNGVSVERGASTPQNLTTTLAGSYLDTRAQTPHTVPG